MYALQDWMAAATIEEQAELLRMADIHKNYLYMLSTGRRIPSAEVAGRIEAATKVLSVATSGRLKVVYRTTLCPACKACPFARNCQN